MKSTKKMLSMERENPVTEKRNDLKTPCYSHQHGLLFSQRIQMSITSVDHSRIKRYADYFLQEYLQPYFEFENRFVFPLLGEETELVQLAVRNHKKLLSLFAQKENQSDTLSLIALELQKYIQLEDRIVFRELQRFAPEHEYAAILNLHKTSFTDNWEDKFWETI